MGASALMGVPLLLNGGLSLIAGGQQAAALEKQAAFIQKQGALNERIGNLQADDAIRRGEKEAKAYGQQVSQLVGKQRVALAAQGIDVDSGSAGEIQDQTRAIGALDQLTIRNNAAREAWGYKVQASNSVLSANMQALGNINQAKASILTGGITALNSFGQAGYAFYGAGGGGKSASLTPTSSTKMGGNSYFDPSGIA